MFGRQLKPRKDLVVWSWDWSHYGFRTAESKSAGYTKPVGKFPFTTRPLTYSEDAFGGFSALSPVGVVTWLSQNDQFLSSKTKFKIGFLLPPPLEKCAKFAHFSHACARVFLFFCLQTAGSIATSTRWSSLIEVRSAKDHLLLHNSYGSPDCAHGMSINRGAWTADSKFFVFNAQALGGHQPWHWPVYFYSRSTNSVRVLDNYLGPIVAPDFTIRPPHIIGTRVLEMQNDLGKPISVDLVRLRRIRH